MSGALTVVQKAYECFGKGDIPGLLNLLAEEVDWLVPGSTEVPWAGRWRGRTQVGGFFAAIGASADFEAFEATEFLDAGNRVVVLGRERTRPKTTGRVYDADWCHVWTVKDGKITVFREYTDTAAVNGAFLT
jgi:uncharacterized protein